MSDTNVQTEPTYRQANVNDAEAISHVIAVGQGTEPGGLRAAALA
jgi:hypothetical protein